MKRREFLSIPAAALGALAADLRLYGIGLWPTVVLHLAMAGWCAAIAMKAKGETR